MLEQLLREALEQAERSEPAVRAAALLHIARAMSTLDHAEAESILERGIAWSQELPKRDRNMILSEAAYVAAAVTPRRALELYGQYARRDEWGGSVVRLVNVMATHGHAAEAIAYLNDPLPGDKFPFSMVNNIFGACGDDETRVGMLRAAICAWRVPARCDFGAGGFGKQAFVTLFSRGWKLLPREEAVRTSDEIVKELLRLKDSPGQFPITANPTDPEFTSEREYLLFRMLPALRQLNPGFTDSLLPEHPELEIAVQRFPMGMESVVEEMAEGPSCQDSMMIGNRRIIPMPEALANDFREAFEEALRRYALDSDPGRGNRAAKEFWPSAKEFRNILFKAGQYQGRSASKHLDRIADPDLRLLAQIELCAALAGLPQIGSMTVFPRNEGLI